LSAPFDPSYLETGLADLETRFEALRQDMSVLLAREGSTADLAMAARALDDLADRLADAPASSGGLDLPACLPVRDIDGRRVPEYLFTAVISQAGITALPRQSRPGGPDIEAYQERLGFMGQTLDAAAFRTRAAELFEATPDCRHYVLLVEDGAQSAERYADLRQAVEDRFYLFRIRR
jgi:hypothetical protein